MRLTIERFGELRTDLAANLLEKGQAADLLNVRTKTGMLRQRPGIEIEYRQTLGEGESYQWPRAVWSRSVNVPTTNMEGSVNETIWEDDSLFTRPDFTQLGNRLFLVDGLLGNTVYEDDDLTRPMGALGQRADFTLSASAAGGSLDSEQYYAYGLRRVLTRGNLEIESPMMVLGVTTGAAAGQVVTVGNIDTYEYSDLIGTGWGIRYELWRSMSGVATVLYKIKTWATSIPAGGTWDDDGTDDEAEADLTATYTVGTDDLYAFPTVTFIREWNGRLIGAGAAWQTGTLTIDSTGSTTMVVSPSIAVRTSQLDGEVRIDGVDGYFAISAVDTTADTWTLEGTIPGAPPGGSAAFVLSQVDDVVYVGNYLPDNIEGYTLGSQVLGSRGSGNRIQGLAVTNAACYILREHRAEIADLVRGEIELVAIPQSPPGCVSHATIADAYSPAVFYYAGRGGIVMLSGGSAQIISAPVERILDEDVLHDYDAHTHGTYDPATGLYHLWLFQAGDVTESHRVPSLLLTYDTERNVWYRDRLPASCSGVWKDDAGSYAVAGILGAVARMNGSGDTDGGEDLEAAATGGTAGTATFAAGTLSGMTLAGLAAYKTAADGTEEMRIVESNDDDAITVASDWTTTPQSGDTIRCGRFPWLWQTGETDWVSGRTQLEGIKKITYATVAADSAPSDAVLKFADPGSSRETASTLVFDEQLSVLRTPACGFRSARMQTTLSGWDPAGVSRIVLNAEEVSRR